MRKLSIGEWASLAEVVASLAVVISLAFVGYSIQRNTDEVRAAQANYMYTASREIDLAVASDPEWSRIIVEGRTGGALTPAEWQRYDGYVVSVLDLWDQLLGRYEDDLVDSKVFEGWDAYFEEFTKRHVTADVWGRIKWNWPSSQLMPRIQRVESIAGGA
jgi:hypothetical protein